MTQTDILEQGELWVFAYGSLLWNPGFEVAQQLPARAIGFHRSFCMWSIHHRGSKTDPGLVLALDAKQGAYCDGVALQAAPGSEADALAGLRERELISSAYIEHQITLEASDKSLTALAYVIDPNHEQYIDEMDLEQQAQIIAEAQGGRGPNCDYLYNTAEQLTRLGVEDPEIDWLVTRVRGLRATNASD